MREIEGTQLNSLPNYGPAHPVDNPRLWKRPIRVTVTWPLWVWALVLVLGVALAAYVLGWLG